MRNPSGAIRCRREAVTAQRRATLPVFGGIFGSTSTTLRRAARASRNSPCAAGFCPLFGAGMAGIAIIANPNARRNPPPPRPPPPRGGGGGRRGGGGGRPRPPPPGPPPRGGGGGGGKRPGGG